MKFKNHSGIPKHIDYDRYRIMETKISNLQADLKKAEDRLDESNKSLMRLTLYLLCGVIFNVLFLIVRS